MNNKYIKPFLFCLLLHIITSNVNNNKMYDLILHPHHRGAYCLDGSPAGMYIH